MSHFETPPNEDGDALAKRTLRLNPDALHAARPLPDLDRIEIVLVQQSEASTRWTEGLLIHLVGSGLFALVGLVIGVVVGLHL